MRMVHRSGLLLFQFLTTRPFGRLAERPPPAFLAAPAKNLGACLNQLLAPAHVAWVNPVQAHALPVFNHGAAVVTETAEGTEIALLFGSPSPAVCDMLHRGGGLFAEHAQTGITTKPARPGALGFTGQFA